MKSINFYQLSIVVSTMFFLSQTVQAGCEFNNMGVLGESEVHNCLNKIEVDKYGLNTSLTLDRTGNLVVTNLSGSSTQIHSINLGGDQSKSFSSSINNGVCRTTTGSSGAGPILLLNPRSQRVQEMMVRRLGECIRIYYQRQSIGCSSAEVGRTIDNAIQQLRGLISSPAPVQQDSTPAAAQ